MFKIVMILLFLSLPLSTSKPHGLVKVLWTLMQWTWKHTLASTFCKCVSVIWWELWKISGEGFWDGSKTGWGIIATKNEWSSQRKYYL